MCPAHTGFSKGEKAPIRLLDGTSWHMGEIIDKRLVDQKLQYYIHFEDYNKRLDEWVSEDRIDFSEIRPNKEINGINARNSGQIADPDSQKHRTGMAVGGNSDDHTTRMKNIALIQYSQYYIEPWYFSPYPEVLKDEKCVYICQFCLSFARNEFCFSRHRYKCKVFHPPGREIYRKNRLSVFEIDGRKQRVYVQRLCLLAKLFLDHKTLFYDTEPFMFYILCEIDHGNSNGNGPGPHEGDCNKFRGFRMVGYFSKEKQSSEDFNVACILTLPPFQRLGYGRFLIEFSYVLSQREHHTGTPEKPLSDFGLLSYRSYWSYVLLNLLVEYSKKDCNDRFLSLNDISEMTAMKKEDILSTMRYLNVLFYYRTQHIFKLTKSALETYNRLKSKIHLTVDDSCLHWTPKDWTRKNKW